MYINFWYPICTSEKLQPAEPLGVELLSVYLVAFRSEDGSAHVLSDTCVQLDLILRFSERD